MITGHLTIHREGLIIATFVNNYGKGRMLVLPVMAVAEPLTS